MAALKPIPLILRTVRTASTPSSFLPSIICSSCRSAIASTGPSTISKRRYSDEPPSKPLTAQGLLLDALKAHPRSPASNIDGSIPSASPAPRPSAIPNAGSIFASMARTSASGPVSPKQPLVSRQVAATISRQKFAETATIVDPQEQMFHLHIYSTKHNTHMTFTDPKRNAIISCSTGNLGFRKAGRHTYDAAYQLASHVFQKIEEKGLIPKKVEVVLRGFGVGREACVKALLGKEGRYLKNVIVRVTDATRTKFGGTRSKKPRRL
ncbi:hypothetical protein ABW19_dt0204782 [Dactylella cylindrospora]|nr:hypothetical protein ABW19_dt0204782 [Dactylella cylindrospora]